MTNSNRINTQLGALVAVVNNSEDYPSISIELHLPNGTVRDLAMVEVANDPTNNSTESPNGVLVIRTWDDPWDECYTHRAEITKDDLCEDNDITMKGD